MPSFSCTKIAIIQSLSPTEFQSGTELKVYLDALGDEKDNFPQLELTDVSDRIAFLGVVERLIDEANDAGCRPILHLELHGWNDKTGLLLADNSSLTWEELAAPLARLNKATGFNLLVCVGACFGAYFLSQLRPLAPSPCYSMIGPTRKISPSDLLGCFRDFYRELLRSLEAATAVRALQARKLDAGAFLTQTAEYWFFKLAQGYLETHCTKARLEQRAANITREIERETGKTIPASTALFIGKSKSFDFLDRAFDVYFMTNEIPENVNRFSAARADANSRARQFFMGQGLLTDDPNPR